MPCEISWTVPQRVIYLRGWDALTMDDISAIRAELFAMLDSGSAPVHLVADYIDVTRMPFSLQHTQAAVDTAPHPHIGWVVNVTINDRMRYITSILLHITSMWMRQFTQVQTAMDFLREVDETLM